MNNIQGCESRSWLIILIFCVCVVAEATERYATAVVNKKDGLDFHFSFGRIPPKSYHAQQPRSGFSCKKTLSPLPRCCRPPVCVRMVAWVVPRPRLAGFYVNRHQLAIFFCHMVQAASTAF